MPSAGCQLGVRCTGLPWPWGGIQGFPFTTTSTDCTPWPFELLGAAPDSVDSSCAETCCMTSLPALSTPLLALPMAAPVRSTTAVTPLSVTPLTTVLGGKAVFVAPLDSQSFGGVISSLTSPAIRLPSEARNGT